jgi:thiamine biosynthesis lipoprotein
VSAEAHLSFECFGGTAAVHVLGADATESESLAAAARRRLLDAHRRLSRFDPQSELSRLNADPSREVSASPLLRRLAAAVVLAGARSGGLVDATLLDAIERAGYRESLVGYSGHSGETAAAARGRSPAGPQPPDGAEPVPARPDPAAHWRQIRVNEATTTISRPPGVGIDSGGLAKGLLADLVAAILAGARSFAVDCCGDLRLGGDRERRVLVEDPFSGAPLHELRVRDGGVATSGVGRRSWDGPGGPAHHILDPSTGRPAHTGIVQATAVAPTALLAEVYAKAALLAGPERAAEWLPHGGVTVSAEGGIDIVAGERPLPQPEPEPAL